MPILNRASSQVFPRFFRRTCQLAVAGAVVCILFPHTAVRARSSTLDAYTNLSLEDLMNIRVTSVSKKEEDLQTAAAAVFVLTRDDIQRSGVTTITDALRMVPGMNVGSINSAQWAVSSRGFNGFLANKLLVLVDGRSVYSPIFAGVFWDLQQVMLEDVDRIEVIRGPGATLWGANAVNGVVNVVSRSAKDTQGTVLYGGGGNVHQALAGVRHGGQTDENTFYRIFSTYHAKDAYRLPEGGSTEDGWNAWHGGMRLDKYPASDIQITWLAGGTVLDLQEGESDAYNIHTLGRWSRDLLSGGNIEIQAYYARTARYEGRERSNSAVDTLDFSFQHTVELGDRNELIWGAGYRSIVTDHSQAPTPIRVRSDGSSFSLSNIFVQNEFQVIPERFSLTAGSKVEHNDFTGFEIQPSLRATARLTERQTAWAAVSRAVRTPSELEGRDLFHIPFMDAFPGPGGIQYLPVLEGGHDIRSEVLWAYEIGYRIQPVERVKLDFAAFYNVYDDIIWLGDLARFEGGAPLGTAVFPWANVVSGNTYGGEAFAVWAATDELRLSIGYSLLLVDLSSQNTLGLNNTDRSAPKNQILLRSDYDLSSRTSVNALVRYVDNVWTVPAHFTADLHFSYRLRDDLNLSLVGHNLLHNHRREQPEQPVATVAEVPRGFYGKLTWRF